MATKLTPEEREEIRALFARIADMTAEEIIRELKEEVAGDE
jgi:hypothetical protein